MKTLLPSSFSVKIKAGPVALIRSLTRSAGVLLAAALLLFSSSWTLPQSASAYPFWAQENYETPREATGKIVCANCHLGAKKTILEVPQSVLPDTVFKAVVEGAL